jgi:hypothetical protein
VISAAAYALRDRSGGEGGGGAASKSPASPACGYKIAYIGILTRQNNADGTTIRDATRMAVDRYNRDHAPCTVTLAHFDTKGQDAEAARLAEELITRSSEWSARSGSPKRCGSCRSWIGAVCR